MKIPLLVLTAALLFGGCLAIPHLDQRSPEIAGLVLDATASRPIKNAKVEFIENPALAVFTDERGEFVIRRTMKPELFVPLGNAGVAPRLGETIPPRLRVTCEGYVSKDVDASKSEMLDVSRHSVDSGNSPPAWEPLFLKPITLDRLPR